MRIPTSDIVIDFSDFHDYQAYSNGYAWMENEHIIAINYLIDSGYSIKEILNSKDLWNRIGSDIFNMPYIQIDGVFSFVIPTFSNVVENDVKRKDIIGRVASNLLNEDENTIFFKNNSKFILYNNEVYVEGLDTQNDANIVNIIFNVISMFLLITLKRG